MIKNICGSTALRLLPLLGLAIFLVGCAGSGTTSSTTTTTQTDRTKSSMYAR